MSCFAAIGARCAETSPLLDSTARNTCQHRFLSCRNAAAGVFGKDSTFHLHRLLHTPIGGKQLGYDCTSGHGPVDQSDLDFADA